MMRLYFSDTKLSYNEINALLNSHIGPSGPDTWQNGVSEPSEGFKGYVEIYNDPPSLSFIVLKWS
jgi:hypothetical protein